jgi:hypothetical protein
MTQHVEFKILRKGDPGPAFPELAERTPIIAELTHACILEDGTINGNPVLALFAELPDHTVACITLTASTATVLSSGFSIFTQPEDN